jgi:hypothetical protein
MKRYFTTLLLSTLMLGSFAHADGAMDISEPSAFPKSNAASPMKAQSVKIAEQDLYPNSHVTECFRIYTPDRKPGVNCVPDASTGH